MYRVTLGLAALLAIPFGASIDGQTTSPLESELVNRIDSLSAILSRAEEVARVADADRREEQLRLLSARIDTFRVGPFLVVTPVGQTSLAKRYFEGAWARYAPIVGPEPTSIEGRVFIFGEREELLGLSPWGGRRVNPRFMPRDRDRAVGRILGGELASHFPNDLRTWVTEFFIRADPKPELEWAYRSLATTASAAVTDCYDGALDRCWDAMGLDHPDEWATAWYTASERQALVRRLKQSSYPGAPASCVDDGRDDECVAALADPDVEPLIPLPPGARMTLLAEVLSLGGPEAYRQLAVGDPHTTPPPEAPLKDRLVRASGVSPDSLIASWRAATFEARPDVNSDVGRIRWSSLFWLAVLAGISTRSTRWRLT